jgi:exodeoxyribonuclease VII small subunit
MQGHIHYNFVFFNVTKTTEKKWCIVGVVDYSGFTLHKGDRNDMAKPTIPNPHVTHFEKSLETLERIVGQLEAGEKPLDESLALYEQGVSALKQCHEQLDHAEQRIRLLVRTANGSPVLREAALETDPSSDPDFQTKKSAHPTSSRRQTPVVPAPKKSTNEIPLFKRDDTDTTVE